MIYTIADIVDELMAEKHIQKKKYHAAYMIHANWTYKDLLWNTIYSVISTWQPVKFDGENYYIDVPKGVLRLLSVSDVDFLGNQYELFYNAKANVVTKKNESCCPCGCGCGEACLDVNSLITTSTYLFTDGGVDYYQKDWIEYCRNGDILLWQQIPTKKYNDIVGDTGDYNDDYNNDYNTVPVFSNYTIINVTKQSKICSLEVNPCGCPKDTDENISKLEKHCGCFMPTWKRNKISHEAIKTGNINPNYRGTIKLSECKTKIIYFPHRHHKHIPKCLLVNFQTDGNTCESIVVIPEDAVDCMKFGIEYRSKIFNNAFPSDEKKRSKYAYEEAKSNLILFRNPISLEWLENVQDAEILW